MPENKKTHTEKSKNDLRREHMEKQIAVKRRRRIVLYCAVILFALVLSAILALTVLFKVTQFDISGKTAYTKDQVITASQLEIGDALYLFNADKAEQRIEEALPMIEIAEITRKLSGKVIIAVKPATAVYAIQHGQKYVLLSDEGKILSISQKKDTKGKTLIIPGVALKDPEPGSFELNFSDFKDEKRETADTLATVLKTFKEQKLNDITEINLKNKSNITIRYQNRITLKFGSVANFENKVKLAIKSLENENEISFDQKGVLDLRVYGEAVFSPSEE
ncbi:MAG: FtsQ-type POTRA domain-containing protein [Clostridia bacterium]|nr:FtsQ-type POTRA domain-containing protein [Clostridia bacterium]